jgi:hypothetical protein
MLKRGLVYFALDVLSICPTLECDLVKKVPLHVPQQICTGQKAGVKPILFLY